MRDVGSGSTAREGTAPLPVSRREMLARRGGAGTAAFLLGPLVGSGAALAAETPRKGGQVVAMAGATPSIRAT